MSCVPVLQEGSGPCVFCDALVCTPEEEEVLRRDSKKAQKFKEKFLKQFQIRVSIILSVIMITCFSLFVDLSIKDSWTVFWS